MAAHVCTPIGDFLCPEDRPSPIFSTFACAVNGIAILWNGIVLLGYSGDCDSRNRTWLILGLLSCIVNCVFAVYIYYRFAQKVRESDDGASTAAFKLFMYDWGVCLYMCFLIWMVVWMIIAGGYASDGGRCGRQLTVTTTFFVIYLIGGVIMVFLSLFTECCRQPRWQQRERVVAQPAAAPGPRGVIGRIFGGGGSNHTTRAQPQHQHQPSPGYQYQQQQQTQPYGQPQQYTYQQAPPAPPAQPQTSGVYAAPPPVNPNYQPQY